MNKFSGGLLILLWGMRAACAQDAQFDIFEYRVEGATLLPAITVEQAVYPHLDEGKSLADVEMAREALEKAYHAAGYLTVLVAIPPQKVGDKRVRLAVTEVPVERLRVVESRYFSLGEIKAWVPQLAKGTVPNFPQMQKELAALNQSPDRRITPVLRPGKTPGTVNAGDAGIRAGNLNISAQVVLGADNIAVSGTSNGTPVADTSAVTATSSGATTAGNDVSSTTAALAQNLSEAARVAENLKNAFRPTLISAEVIGHGE